MCAGHHALGALASFGFKSFPFDQSYNMLRKDICYQCRKTRKGLWLFDTGKRTLSASPTYFQAVESAVTELFRKSQTSAFRAIARYNRQHLRCGGLQAAMLSQVMGLLTRRNASASSSEKNKDNNGDFIPTRRASQYNDWGECAALTNRDLTLRKQYNAFIKSYKSSGTVVV